MKGVSVGICYWIGIIKQQASLSRNQHSYVQEFTQFMYALATQLMSSLKAGITITTMNSSVTANIRAF